MKALRRVTVSCLAILMFGCAPVEEKEEREQESEKEVELEDLPAAVRATVIRETRGLKIIGFTEETERGETVYEVELEVQGLKRDLTMDLNGDVVTVEDEIPIDSLPEPVRAGIRELAGDGNILLVESITERGRLTAYEAEIEAAGKKSELKVDPLGRPLP